MDVYIPKDKYVFLIVIAQWDKPRRSSSQSQEKCGATFLNLSNILLVFRYSHPLSMLDGFMYQNVNGRATGTDPGFYPIGCPRQVLTTIFVNDALCIMHRLHPSGFVWLVAATCVCSQVEPCPRHAMFIVRVPIELAPLRKAKGYYPLAFALAPRRLGCKTITPRDKPSRSAAELYGEHGDHSVFWGCQLDWHSDCERFSFADTTDSRSPRLATSPLCVNGCPFPPPGALRRVMSPSCPTSSWRGDGRVRIALCGDGTLF